MNFQEAEKRYAALRDQLNQRQITEDQFAEQVFGLRLQDAKGAWWQINGADGSWLLWDGSAWQRANPPQPAPVQQPKKKSQAAQPVERSKKEGSGILGWFSGLGKGSKKPEAEAAGIPQMKVHAAESPQMRPQAAQMDALQQQVHQIIIQRAQEGYMPTHPSVAANLWGSTLSAVIQAGVPGFTCGHCQHFSGWGIQWLWPVATQIFGEQVTVSEITCYRNEWISHKATRLILPDGQRFVIDFWESLLAGESRIYPENDWVDHYRARVGGEAQILTMEGRS